MSRLRLALCIAAVPLLLSVSFDTDAANAAFTVSAATVNQPIAADRSRPLWTLANPQRPVIAEEHEEQTPSQRSQGAPAEPPKNAAGAKVEQTTMGTKAAAELVDSFDGLGVGFEGPHGMPRLGNPSDNSLAVGPDHIVQTVNTRMAIFTKKGKKYDTTGKVLYGGVPNNTVFAGFTGICEATNNGDTVVRYDQLADRWLIVMPIFRRAAPRPDQPPMWKGGDTVWTAPPGVAGQPGKAATLFVPPPAPPPPPAPAGGAGAPPPARGTGAGAGGGRAAAGGPPQTPPQPPPPHGPYAMCYAVSTSSDPMGEYYRYEFQRPLFPDYPRPAVWPDGYYVPTSTSDDFIEKHICVADRNSMLKGSPATEQCVVIDGVSFLNTVDLEGKRLPPDGAPNLVLAAGGSQLNQVFGDDGVYVWQFKVDWKDSKNTKVTGPVKIAVAPYQFLCRGQLTSCVPQPGTDRRLDAQGDKLMARAVYRNLGNRESIVAVHSVNTEAAGGGVRWYEFQVGGRDRSVTLRQQGTYAPDGFYRWMASPAIDRLGNIGIGYSFGGTPHYAGQRFAGRLANDPLGQLTLKETVLVEGAASQTNTLRWEDYTQTAVDPSDDCTVWYVGDYYKKDATNYSSRIGGFRMPGCSR